MSTDQQDPATLGYDPEALALRGTVASVSCNDVYSFTKPVRDEITLIAGLGVEGDVHAGVTVRHRSRVAADPTQPNLRQVHLIRAELHGEARAEGYDVPAGGLGENVTTVGLDLLALPCGTILRFGRRFTASDTAVTKPAPVAGAAGAEPAPVAGAAGTEPAAASSGAVATAGAAAVIAAAAKAALDDSTAIAVAALAARVRAEPVDTPDDRAAVVVTGLRNPCQQINDYRSGLLKLVLGRDADGNLVRKAGIMGVVLRGGPVRPGDPIEVELPAPPYLPLDRV